MSELTTHKVADITLTYHPIKPVTSQPKIVEASKAATLFRENWNDTLLIKEEFMIMLLNNGNRLLGIAQVSKGGVNGTFVDPKIIFCTALKALASNIILAHNHPSGNLKPSKADIRLTRKLVEGGRLLDVAVVDHLIITEDGHFSFAKDGLIP